MSMTGSNDSPAAHDELIARLVADLTPAPRLYHPFVRAGLWLLVVVALSSALVFFSDAGAVTRRLAAAPIDVWLAHAGSISTAVLAAIAVFELSLPDRKAAWALLPAPALLLWIAGSGAGCLRSWVAPGTHIADFQESRHCLMFVIGFSIPLAALLVFMLRRAHPWRLNLVSAVGGLAVAAASAGLLELVHPYDAAAINLLFHFSAAAIVILLNMMCGSWVLRDDDRFSTA